MSDSDMGSRRLSTAGVAFIVLQAAYFFAVATAFGAVVNTKLNGPLANGDHVEDFKISPDGSWVVYRAGSEIYQQPPDPTIEQYDLFSVPIEGGTPVRLNALLPAEKTVEEDYAITADSARVVYRAAQDDLDKVELYSVAIDGPAGSGLKLNDGLPAGGNVEAFRLVPGSSPGEDRVVYTANQDSSSRIDAYTIPIAGPTGAGVRINDLSQSEGVLPDSIQISPDSQWALYTGPLSTGGAGLFCASASGPRTPVIQLNGLLVPGGNVFWYYVQISRDSSRVVYIADQQSDEQNELYSVPIRGPASLGEKLNGPLVADGDVAGFAISPDSQWVAYFADQEMDAEWRLFGVPIGGAPGGGQKISHDPAPGLFLHFSTLLVSPDSSRVVYYESKHPNSQESGQIYSAFIDGPATAAIRLNRPLVSGGGVSESFRIAGGTGRVVYIADQDTDNAFELYSVPAAGPAEEGVKINRSLGSEGDVMYFSISPDGQQVAYVADRIRLFLGDDVFRLWAVPTLGPGSSSVLHGPPPVTGGDVSFRFEYTPDSSRIVYIADQETDGVKELYVSYDQPAAAQRWQIYR